MGVKHVPICVPSTMGTALPNVTTPVSLSACRMPTLAEDDWMATVAARPARRPSSGFSSAVNTPMKNCESFSGATAVSIMNMPVNRMPKPSIILPRIAAAGRFEKHIQDSARKSHDGREGGGVDNLHQQAVTGDIRHADNLPCNGGADVCAHDDAHIL